MWKLSAAFLGQLATASLAPYVPSLVGSQGATTTEVQRQMKSLKSNPENVSLSTADPQKTVAPPPSVTILQKQFVPASSGIVDLSWIKHVEIPKDGWEEAFYGNVRGPRVIDEIIPLFLSPDVSFDAAVALLRKKCTDEEIQIIFELIGRLEKQANYEAANLKKSASIEEKQIHTGLWAWRACVEGSNDVRNYIETAMKCYWNDRICSMTDADEKILQALLVSPKFWRLSSLEKLPEDYLGWIAGHYASQKRGAVQYRIKQVIPSAVLEQKGEDACQKEIEDAVQKGDQNVKFENIWAQYYPELEPTAPESPLVSQLQWLGAFSADAKAGMKIIPSKAAPTTPTTTTPTTKSRSTTTAVPGASVAGTDAPRPFTPGPVTTGPSGTASPSSPKDLAGCTGAPSGASPAYHPPVVPQERNKEGDGNQMMMAMMAMAMMQGQKTAAPILAQEVLRVKQRRQRRKRVKRDKRKRKR